MTRKNRHNCHEPSLTAGLIFLACEFCSGCDNRGGGRTDQIYQPYIDGLKEIREINEEFRNPVVRG